MSTTTSVIAFGQATGQGWTQVAELAIALVLSMAIGLEREVQQKSAGIRTYPLVGVGSALFVLFSKYGFTDVLDTNIALDPSRVAAQIVTGVGFIGGGLIFVRRDTVHGLTTAASVWLTAAVGAAAGGGLVVLAAVATGMYFVVLYGARPLMPWIRKLQSDEVALRVTYLDREGVLRQVLGTTTGHGFLVTDIATARSGSGGHARGRSDESDGDIVRELAEQDLPRSTVDVTISLTGGRDLTLLTARLSELDGVLAVRSAAAAAE